MRLILAPAKVSPAAAAAMSGFHHEAVKRVEQAVQAHEWAVIGMAGNIFVKKARKHLESKGKAFEYVEYGSYLNEWKTRLAIKLWSGWPTFPQVFHQGILVGGYSDLAKYLP